VPPPVKFWITNLYYFIIIIIIIASANGSTSRVCEFACVHMCVFVGQQWVSISFRFERRDISQNIGELSVKWGDCRLAITRGLQRRKCPMSATSINQHVITQRLRLLWILVYCSVPAVNGLKLCTLIAEWMSNQLERLLFFIVSIANDRWPGQVKVKWCY